MIKTDNQDLMRDLGYPGYIGIIGLQRLQTIPDVNPLGGTVLVALIIIAAVIVIRMRLGSG